MSDKYKGIYRGQTFRLQNWDYGSEGLYFITICTKNREQFFGQIENKKMILSEIGELAKKYWFEIENQFSFIKLGEFVVMPNHVHGILEIDKSRINCDSVDEINGGFSGIKNPMFHENISRVIRWYKGRCTYEMRKVNVNFKWQSLFHDHIIQNQESFEKIQNYIINNPQNWIHDKLNK